jgi:fumarate reductase subunit C
MRTYTRPVSGTWWTKKPFYRWYMLRELSSLFITLYALVLLWGLWQLRQGRAPYETWLASLASPAWLGFHALTFILVVVHAWTWFKVMPKTLPRIPLSDNTVVTLGVSALVAVSAVLLWIA